MNEINLKDFLGNTGDIGYDIEPIVKKALCKCKEASNPVLNIPYGIYHFWPDETYEVPYYISNHDDSVRKIAFLLKDFNNLTIDGNGSEFIFHGRILPFAIDHSENIHLKNISIDYHKPLFAQGIIMESALDHLDIKIDREEYPFEIRDKQIFFYSEDFKGSHLYNFLEMDVKTCAPAYMAGDEWCEPAKIEAEELGDNIVRFKGKFRKLHTVGNIMVMCYELRICPGFFINQSSNVALSDVNIYHSGAMGVIAQNSRDITLKRVDVRLREGSKRLLSANADATHFVNCTGTVELDNCTFENQNDDALNCHGIYTVIKEICAPNKLITELMHHQQHGINIYQAGDKVSFINRNTMQAYSTGVVKKSMVLDSKSIEIEFEEYLPEWISVDDAVENPLRMPDIIIKNCRAGKNRARGFLITTPGKVICENNEIYSPGAAILIEGDVNYWFESGQVKDVSIRNNIFTDCAHAEGWGKAVIQISPVVRQVEPEAYFHSNIRIEGNTFNTFDLLVLSAFNVCNITFKDNLIKKTDRYTPINNDDSSCIFRECKDIDIENNRVMGFEETIKSTDPKIVRTPKIDD